jgi:hypothetical protein
MTMMTDTLYPKHVGHVDLGPETFLAIVETQPGWFAIGHVSGETEQTLMVTDAEGLLTLSNLFVKAALTKKKPKRMAKKVDDE